MDAELRKLMSWVKSADDDYTEGTAARWTPPHGERDKLPESGPQLRPATAFTSELEGAPR